MDFALSKEQAVLVEQVRALCEQELHPYFMERWDRGPDFDWWPVRRLGELNLICPVAPQEYGGRGLDMLTTCLLMEELAACWPGLATVITANCHAVQPLLLAGTQMQKERFLPLLVGKNGGLSAFALTESSSGSDLNAMYTCGQKHKDGFIINGAKEYVLNAPQASFISLFAMTDPHDKKASMRCFLAPAGTAGVRMTNPREMAALNYAQIAHVGFEDTFIDHDAVIRADALYSGYLLLSQTFDIGRVLVSASSVGVARAAFELARAHSEQRVQFGAAIKNHQAVAHTLAEMATKINMARLMVWRAGWLIDQKEDYAVASSMAKYAASEIAQEVTQKAADILAATAFEKGAFMEQLLRDARVLSTVEGTNNMQKNLIASLL